MIDWLFPTIFFRVKKLFPYLLQETYWSKIQKTESNVNYRVSVYPNVALSLKIHGTTVLDDGPLNSVTLQHPERDCSMAVYTFDGNENVEYLVYDGGMYREIALRGLGIFIK